MGADGGRDWRPLRLAGKVPVGAAAFAETAPSPRIYRPLCGTSLAVRMRRAHLLPGPARSRPRAPCWSAWPSLHATSLPPFLCLDGLEIRGFESSKLVLLQNYFLDSNSFAYLIFCVSVS